jgi:ligand-binding sensor domain-containing protein
VADDFQWVGALDGVRFTVFDKSNTKGLSTNRFTALYENKDGTLWIGTGDGGLTFYRNGEFKTLTVEDGVPGGQVWTLTLDLNAELLIAGFIFVMASSLPHRVSIRLSILCITSRLPERNGPLAKAKSSR